MKPGQAEEVKILLKIWASKQLHVPVKFDSRKNTMKDTVNVLQNNIYVQQKKLILVKNNF